MSQEDNEKGKGEQTKDLLCFMSILFYLIPIPTDQFRSIYIVLFLAPCFPCTIYQPASYQRVYLPFSDVLAFF